LLALLAFTPRHLISQNLVINPSFEAYSKCESKKDDFHCWDCFSPNGWTKPTRGTTDFMCPKYDSTCSQYFGKKDILDKHIPKNDVGYQFPKEGDCCIGLAPGEEFVQGELKEALKAGKVYKISLFINMADKAPYYAPYIGIFFSSKQIEYCDDAVKLMKFLHLKSQVTFPLGKKFSDTLNWVEVTQKYKAKGGEIFFTIGYTATTGKLLPTGVPVNNDLNCAYYYIDNVYIGVIKDSLENIPKKETVTLSGDFLFDFNKYELKKTAYPKLDSLVASLKKKNYSKIEIIGYTDSIGTVASNEKLSMLRSKSVSDYLIKNGMDNSKISSIGLGSKQPVANNRAEAGRKLNRRVEFIINE
jgi:OmpA-OmpF porin, OOP family